MLFAKHATSKKLLLYSHGNAEDVTNLQSMMAFLRSALAVNVLIYEYVGYLSARERLSAAGVTEAALPDEQSTYNSINAAFQWATEVQKFECKNICEEVVLETMHFGDWFLLRY
jgi:hypothetical protein